MSRFVTDDYWHRQCGLFFPEEDGYTYASARGKRPAALNKQTHGWFGKTERLLWVQGLVSFSLFVCIETGTLMDFLQAV